MKLYHLKCYLCGKVHKQSESVTDCIKCNGPLETYYDYESLKKDIDINKLKTDPISSAKYNDFYPIDGCKNIVSLQEGNTPLVHAMNLGKTLGLKNLYIKNESVNPTGCFKDRGTLIEIAKAKELGFKAICLASTGNMAASVAAYASKSNIPCYVLVPEGTPIGKLSQTLSFGARVLQIRSSYSRCANLAVEMAKKFGYYLAGDYTFRIEGQKSCGYEIIEQLLWNSPDYIVCPIGGGTNLHAIYKGMKEFQILGLISKLPKIIGVQTPGCNPIYKAFLQKRRDFDIQENPSTIASAMAVGDPADGEKILADIYESKGLVVEVSDKQILIAQGQQAKSEGIFAEPSGSMAIAAIKKLNESKQFKKDDIIVCIANGNGLKDPKAPLKILSQPISIEPNFKEIETFIEQKLYAVSKGIGGENEITLIIDKKPSKKELIEILNKQYGIEANKQLLNAVLREIEDFLEKGKKISISDLQFILEEILDELCLKNKVIEIIDFSAETFLHSESEAKICINAFGEKICTKSKGVGPVDAAIKALKKGLNKHDKLKIKLEDYEVEIDSKGSDATVTVKMTLVDKNGNKVIAKTTSPDVIIASIKAYEKGFNILYSKINIKY